MVKSRPEMQETQVQSICWEDPLEKGMTTHPSILARRIPWMREPDVHGAAESDTNELANTFPFTHVSVYVIHLLYSRSYHNIVNNCAPIKFNF